MRERILRTRLLRQPTEFSSEERTQLTTIIDLLIPADDTFPTPSSLHLIDEFLSYLNPSSNSISPQMLTSKRLRAVLRDLNTSSGGRFCSAPKEKQQALLQSLEQRDPAFFQSLWTLANHSYYTHLANDKALHRKALVVS